MRLPANITGGTYTSPAVQLSAQLTRNWYPELQEDGSYTLMPWYGYTSFSSDQTGSDRGMLFHRGVLYKVSGITLYSVNSSGTSTSLGTVQGSLPVVIKGFGKNILIATGEGRAYEYDTSTLSELTDSYFESPKWVAVLKNFAIWGGDEDRFVVSAFSDASDINALDYARAETSADDLLRGETFGEELYLFGTRTLERWFTSGVGRPPFAFRDSAPIGIASRMSVAKNDQYMYWLADDRKVYRVPGLQPVQDIGLANVIENYTTVDDAIAFCCTKQGQNFYHLSFPTEDETWVYCESVNEWINLSRNTTSGRDLANSYAYGYGKHLVGDYSGANIWEWDQSSYLENTSEIERERITRPLDGKLLGVPGRDIELNRFELFCEMGVGNEYYTISALSGSYDSKSLDISAQELNISGGAISVDGTKLYIVGTANDTVYQYTLSTPFDVSTGTYDTVSFLLSGSSPTSICFADSGKKLFDVDLLSDLVSRSTLTTAWDLSTAADDSNTFNVSTQEADPRAVFVTENGSKMYIGGNDLAIYQYSMSTPYDLTTASYDSLSLDVSSEATLPISGIVIQNEKVWIVDGADVVYEYDLSDANDISTGAYTGISLSMSSEDSDITDIFLAADAGKIYGTGQTNDTVYQYSMTQTFPARDPQICLQVSTNRGKTFGTERWASVGKSGEYENEVIWNNLGRAKSFVFKIKASDNAQFVIRDASIDFEIGI